MAAALDFPSIPSIGQIYPDPAVAGQPQYQWNGEAWLTVGSATDAVRKSGDFMSGYLTLVGDPTTDKQAATKKYVDDRAGGGTGGGAPYSYVDTQDALRLLKAGDTMTGPLTMTSSGPTVVLDKSVSNGVNMLVGRTAGKDRWWLQVGDGNTETGGNLGSNFAIYRYNDAGALMGDGITPNFGINRTTGDAQLQGNLTVKPQTGTAQVVLDKTAGQSSVIGRKGGADRWQLQLGSGDAESGANNSGSNFGLYSYSDGGALIGAALSITRATRNASFYGDLGVAGNFYGQAAASITGVLTAGGLSAGGSGIQSSLFNAYSGNVGFTGRLTSPLVSADSTSSIGSATYSGSLQLQCAGNQQAYMTFHIGGVLAQNFGMDANGNFYCGGASYGGTVYKFWTTRDFASAPVAPTTDVTDGRLAMGADWGVNWNGGMTEPYAGCVMTGCQAISAPVYVIQVFRMRWMQLYKGGWYTVGVA